MRARDTFGEILTMPRFVILEHDYPTTHWDLMLESDSVLRTWRLTRPPQSGEAFDATVVFDHRLFYLDYQGPISGGRGNVVRWEWGTFKELEMNASRLAVHLTGERLAGVLVLERAEGDAWRGEFQARTTPNL